MDYEQLKKLMSEQTDEMTAAERLKAYNAREEVDYNPYTLQAPDPAMADIFGFTTTQFAKDFEVKSEIIRRRREEFGLDSFNVGLGLKTIGTPKVNVEAFIYAVRKYGRGARLGKMPRGITEA